MAFYRRKARAEGARALATWVLIGAAGALIAAGAKRKGVFDQLASPQQLARLRQWLRTFADNWFSRSAQPPLLETESRAGKDVYRSQPAPVSAATAAHPAVESEPRSGLDVPRQTR
jgi:hypothetical protein